MSLLLAALVVLGVAAAPTTAPAGAATPVRTRTYQPLQEMFHSYGDAGASWRTGRPRTWTGGDSTFSVRLPDGRTVWMFSDTFLAPTNGCAGTDPQPCHKRSLFGSPFVNNTFVVQSGSRLVRTVHGGTSAAPAANIVPPAPHDLTSFYWMGDATVEGAELRVFVHRYPKTYVTIPPTPESTDVATFSLPDLRLRTIDPGVGAGGLRPWAFGIARAEAGTPVIWGNGVLEDGAYTYVYGSAEHTLVKELYVARAPRGRLTSAPWEYYTGTAWSPDPTAARRVLGGVAGELSVVRTDHGYRLVASHLGIGDVMLHTAPRPGGPWDGGTLLYVPPERARGAWAYNAHEHPQYSRPGRIVFSYNVNGSIDGRDVYADAHVYRPRFVEVLLDRPVRVARSR